MNMQYNYVQYRAYGLLHDQGPKFFSLELKNQH